MKRARGFTLLEVLAALAVLGLLLAALAQGVQFGLRAWQVGAREVVRPAALETLDRTLRRLVARVVAEDEVDGRGAVVGAPALLDVITLLPADPDGGLPAPAPAEARLAVDAAHRLVLEYAPRPHAQWIGPVPQRASVLLEHVERVEFAYWQEAPGGGGAWTSTWEAPTTPALIRIRIIFPRGDGRHWPDIVAAPALGPLSAALPFGESSRYLRCADVEKVNIGTRVLGVGLLHVG